MHYAMVLTVEYLDRTYGVNVDGLDLIKLRKEPGDGTFPSG
jgi:hypothetical protein